MASEVNINPPRRTAVVWMFVTALAIFGIFAPELFGIDGFNGGFALSALSILLAITGIIVVVIYLKLAKAVDRAVGGDDLLVHWKYKPEEWKEYTEKEFAEDKGAKKGIFLMIAIISVIVGIGFVIFNPDSITIVPFIIVGLIVLIGAVAFISARYDHWENVRRQGEAYIFPDGVYLNRRIHLWKGIGNKLEAAALEDQYRHQPRLKFDYSSPGRHSRNYYTVRVPVPAGEEATAKRVLDQILAAHKLETVPKEY